MAACGRRRDGERNRRSPPPPRPSAGVTLHHPPWSARSRPPGRAPVTRRVDRCPARPAAAPTVRNSRSRRAEPAVRAAARARCNASSESGPSYSAIDVAVRFDRSNMPSGIVCQNDIGDPITWHSTDARRRWAAAAIPWTRTRRAGSTSRARRTCRPGLAGSRSTTACVAASLSRPGAIRNRASTGACPCAVGHRRRRAVRAEAARPAAPQPWRRSAAAEP